MANTKISALTADTAPTADDLVVTVNDPGGTPATRKATITNFTKAIPAVIGDSGSGGTKGLVPAPGAGDAAANKFLHADGTFKTPAGSGSIGGSSGSTDNALIRADGAGGSTVQSSAITVDDDGAITVPEIAAPSTPATAKVVIYAKSDGKLYIKDDAGTETDLTSAGSGSPGGSSGDLQYNDGAGGFAGSPMNRLDANTIEQSNGTSATDICLNLYGLKNGANYERLRIRYSSGGLNYFITSDKGGTGTTRPIGFQIDSTEYWRLTTAGEWKAQNSASRLVPADGAENNPSINWGTNVGIYKAGSDVGITAGSSLSIVFNGTGPIIGSSERYRFASTSLSSGTTADTGIGRQQAGVLEVNNGTNGQRGCVLLRAHTFAQLPGTPIAGTLATVSDSNTATWGATIAGGGANNVLARYNGTNWTVVGA